MKAKLKRLTSWSSLPAIVLFIVFLIINVSVNPGFLSPSFLHTYLMANTPALCVIMGICAAKIAGGIDISLGCLLALVNCTVAQLSSKTDMEFGPIVLIALAIGLFGGTLNGVMIGIFRITPLLATFATNYVFGGLALWVMPTPGGFNVSKVFIKFYNTLLGGFFPPTMIFILVPLIIWLFFSKSPMGVRLYAIGRDEQNAYISGMPVAGVKMFVHIFGGLAAALGGIAVTGMIASGDPLVGTELSLRSIAAVVIGGVALAGGEGDIWGAVFGGLFLNMVQLTVVNTKIPTFTQNLANAAILFFGLLISIIISARSNSAPKMAKLGGAK